MWERFKYWFKNVYWYHYRVHTLVGLAAAVMLIAFIHDIVTRVDPDLSFAYLTGYYASEEQLEALDGHFGACIDDLDGDGRTVAAHTLLTLGGDDGEMAYAMQQKLTVTVIDDSVHLYLCAESALPFLEGILDVFVDLGELGYETSESMPYAVEVTASPLLTAQSLSYEPVYAMIRYLAYDRNEQPQKGQEAMRQNALTCLDALLEGA